MTTAALVDESGQASSQSKPGNQQPNAENSVNNDTPNENDNQQQGENIDDDTPLWPEDQELPLPYQQEEDGSKKPLQGVQSIFLTGTTCDLVGIVESEATPYTTIEKAKLLHDIQFRGAISDFQVAKQQIQDADYDPLLIKLNADDRFGDGNNYELATLQSAASIWEITIKETQRRERVAAKAAAEKKVKKALPRSQKVLGGNEWVTLGSEEEIKSSSVQNSRELLQATYSKALRHFSRECNFECVDAQELWNSSQMECRPFKDPNYDLTRAFMDKQLQATADTVDQAVQATGSAPRPASTQYQPVDIDKSQKDVMLRTPQMAQFLEKALPRIEEALIQNVIVNIYEDDFALLSEEVDGLGSSQKGSIMNELQSFTDLKYSKNRIITDIQWLPQQKGMVATSCSESWSFSQRLENMGQPHNGSILVWNFKDPIHPEYVLEGPTDITCFKINPVTPNIVVAGCHNGLIALWDISSDMARITAAKASDSSSAGGDNKPSMVGKQEEGAGREETQTLVIPQKYCSTVEASHSHVVSDLRWLPGIEVTKDGKVKEQEGCFFLATTAADGKVMFWDIRLEKSARKGRRAEDSIDTLWRPLYMLSLLSIEGRECGCTGFVFTNDLKSGELLVASMDGELLHANFVKPDNVENHEFVKSILPATAGEIVSLQLSPIFPDILVAVGDWSFQIWKIGMTQPLFVSPWASDQYTIGRWSPTRAGVLYVTQSSGTLEVWDLLDRTHEPSICTQVSSSPIRSMAFPLDNPQRQRDQQQQVVACGDGVGTLHILAVPRTLSRPVSSEVKNVQAYFDREQQRIEELSQRKSLRAECKKEQEKESQSNAQETVEGQQHGAGAAGEANKAAQDQSNEEEEYLQLEKELRELLGVTA